MSDYYDVLLSALSPIVDHPKRTIFLLSAVALAAYYLIVVRLEIRSLNDFLDTAAMFMSGIFILAVKAALELPFRLTVSTIDVVMKKIAGSTQYIISHVKLPKIDLPFVHL
jgi:hypothetical protein